MKKQLIVVAHNIRSAHNIGSILRTAEGLGIEHVYLTGYSPYPQSKNDVRLPHLAKKVSSRIKKTSLGAEKTAAWTHLDDVVGILKQLRDKGYIIAALEQTNNSKDLTKFTAPKKIALLIGSEVGGVAQLLIDDVDLVLQIPMLGKKDSYNVSVAAAMAMYHLSFR